VTFPGKSQPKVDFGQSKGGGGGNGDIAATEPDGKDHRIQQKLKVIHLTSEKGEGRKKKRGE